VSASRGAAGSTSRTLASEEVGDIPVLLRTPSNHRCSALVLAFDPSPLGQLDGFAALLPFPTVNAWIAYLGLPLVGYRQPAGGEDELRRRQRDDYLLELLAPAVTQAVRELPLLVATLRGRLGLHRDGALALFGLSAGGLATLLALAERPLPIDAAVITATPPDARSAVHAAEQSFATSYGWTSAADAMAARLDFTKRAAEIARRTPALLAIRGAADIIVTASGHERLGRALRPHYRERPSHLSLRTVPDLGHQIDARGIVATLADDWLARHLNGGF
jgi:pimeloyl-ACP methyl ester carboxylesterase